MKADTDELGTGETLGEWADRWGASHPMPLPSAFDETAHMARLDAFTAANARVPVKDRDRREARRIDIGTVRMLRQRAETARLVADWTRDEADYLDDDTEQRQAMHRVADLLEQCTARHDSAADGLIKTMPPDDVHTAASLVAKDRAADQRARYAHTDRLDPSPPDELDAPARPAAPTGDAALGVPEAAAQAIRERHGHHLTPAQVVMHYRRLSKEQP